MLYSGILVKSGEKVLLCKRCSKCSLPNTWSIPSGHVESGESALDGAMREFYEETNIKVKNINLVGMFKPASGNGLFYAYLHNSPKELIPDLENAKDGHEHTQCNYFTFDEIPKDDTTEELLEIIKKVLKS